ncbi:MAG: hypothetical protein ACI4UE_06245 [Candidatus Scatovivens sp.]
MKDNQNTHANTTGINGKVKYVVPLNKQTGETVVLTEDGKLYKNKKDIELFGNSFEVILNEYSFLEILEIPNQEELMFLTKEGKIISKDGTLYLDLFGENKPENSTNEENEIEKYPYEKYEGLYWQFKDDDEIDKTKIEWYNTKIQIENGVAYFYSGNFKAPINSIDGKAKSLNIWGEQTLERV